MKDEYLVLELSRNGHEPVYLPVNRVTYHDGKIREYALRVDDGNVCGQIMESESDRIRIYSTSTYTHEEAVRIAKYAKLRNEPFSISKEEVV